MTTRHPSLLRLLVALALALVVFAACGGDDDETSGGNGGGGGDGGGGGGTTLELSAVDNNFEPTELSAAAGEEVTVEVTNDGSNPHTFSSEDGGFDSGTVDPGSSASVSFTMPDAETEFVCNVHGAAMSGTLVPEG
ncbi:MAG: cupredoxin domain-containing protein [Actinomycetota bacterium]